jgi:O-antigen/teichoic acid export membrane protein
MHPGHEDSAGHNVRQVVSCYFAVLLCNGVALGLSFASTLLLTKRLGPGGYGQWSVFVAVVTGAVLVGTSWTQVSLVRHGCEEWLREGSIRRAFWERTGLLLASLLVLGGVLWAAAPWIAGAAGGLRGAAGLVFAGAVASALSLHTQHALQAANRMRQAGLVQVIERAALFGGLAALLGLGYLSFGSAVVVFILSGLLGAGTIGFFLQRRVWLPITWDGPMRRALLSFSLPYLLLYAFSFLSTGYLDVLVLQRFLPLHDVGMYYLANQMAGLFTQVSTVACTVLVPLLTSLTVLGQSETTTLYLRRVLPHLILAWSVILAVAVTLSPAIFPLCFGSAFRPVAAPFSILMVACSLAGIVQFGYAPLANAWKMTWLNTCVGITSGLVNLAMDWLLIPRFGVAGCAAASVVASVVAVCLLMSLTHKKMGIGGIAHPLVATLPVPVAVLLSITGQSMWIGFASAAAATGVVVWACNLFSPEDRKWLGRIGSRWRRHTEELKVGDTGKLDDGIVPVLPEHPGTADPDAGGIVPGRAGAGALPQCSPDV